MKWLCKYCELCNPLWLSRDFTYVLWVSNPSYELVASSFVSYVIYNTLLYMFLPITKEENESTMEE